MSSRRMLRLSTVLVLVLAVPALAVEPLSPADEAFFETKVRPILVARCFECHGPDKQKGSVRLDSREAFLKGMDGQPLFIAGKPEESRLIEVLGYEDAIRMPPTAKLPDGEIATLAEWVRRGAPFPASESTSALMPASPEGIAQARATHWAYQPIRHHDSPVVKDTAWPSTAIDRFVLARLEEAGLTPSPAADRPTLLRRATYDLTGLPPTFEDLQAFMSDERPDAWEQVIDRLLASPQYGERWARHWLDVARYSDTKGYVFTEERKYPFSYTYRDYVIRAFNDDKPFDRFVLEQLAADQLPLGDDKTPLAAMGYLTLGRRFGNNINDIIDDRIDVVGRGLLGLAVGCARCHDHKYDPIPTADYYSLYGVFSASMEPGDLPQIGAPEASEGYAQFEQELKTKEQAVREFVDVQVAELQDDLRRKSGEYLAAVLQAGDRPLDRFGFSFGRGEIRRSMVERWRGYVRNTAKQPDRVFEAWNRFAKLPPDKFADQAAATLNELKPVAAGPAPANTRIREALEKSPPKSMADVAKVYGEVLVAVHQEWLKLHKENPSTAGLPDAEAEELRKVLYSDVSPISVSWDDAQKLFDRATRNKARELQKAVDTLKANSPAAPPRAMVLNDVQNPPRMSHVLIRGNPNRPGPEVPRRFLQVLSRPDDRFQKGSGRLELANAIVHPDNPLTARVIVNRVWMHHFGQGLVRTPSDFGVRGERPTHPELLDELARGLIEDGWSLKRLHKRILMSQTWQQASLPRDGATLKDPENRRLWRMNPRRLEFEAIRDSLLAVAGRLDPAVGGRAVDLFSQPFTRRRTVYGFIDRQDLPGLFRSFDFATPDVSTPQRPQTTVPQQALFAMNSPFVIEQARKLAARPEVASGPAPEKIRTLYRLVFARDPLPEELSVGQEFVESAAQSGTAMSPLEQLAQALLLSNEFVFVD